MSRPAASVSAFSRGHGHGNGHRAAAPWRRDTSRYWSCWCCSRLGGSAGWGLYLARLSDSCAWRSTVKSRGRRRGRACTRRQYYLLGSEGGIRRCVLHSLPRAEGAETSLLARRHRESIAQPYGRTPGCRGAVAAQRPCKPRPAPAPGPAPAQHQPSTSRSRGQRQFGVCQSQSQPPVASPGPGARGRPRRRAHALPWLPASQNTPPAALASPSAAQFHVAARCRRSTAGLSHRARWGRRSAFAPSGAGRGRFVTDAT